MTATFPRRAGVFPSQQVPRLWLDLIGRQQKQRPITFESENIRRFQPAPMKKSDERQEKKSHRLDKFKLNIQMRRSIFEFQALMDLTEQNVTRLRAPNFPQICRNDVSKRRAEFSFFFLKRQMKRAQWFSVSRRPEQSIQFAALISRNETRHTDQHTHRSHAATRKETNTALRMEWRESANYLPAKRVFRAESKKFAWVCPRWRRISKRKFLKIIFGLKWFLQTKIFNNFTENLEQAELF